MFIKDIFNVFGTFWEKGAKEIKIAWTPWRTFQKPFITIHMKFFYQNLKNIELKICQKLIFIDMHMLLEKMYKSR